MIGAAIAKDVRLLLRDRGVLISLFALPVVFMTVFGFMFGSGQRGTPRTIAVWHAPGDPRGAAVLASLAETAGFSARPLADADAVRRAVAAEDVPAGLVIAGAASEPVELVIDLAAPIGSRAPIQGALTAIVERALRPDPGPPVVIARSPPGIAKPLAGISSFQVTVPGNAVMFGFFIALSVALSFTSERRSGTWRRLLAAPVPRWKALLGTLVPYYLIGVCQLAFLFGVGAVAFGMQVAGSLSALVVLSLCVTLCAVSLGLLLASFGGSEKQLGGVGSVVLLVMGMLGGSMMPRLIMPSAMQSVGLAVPHSWALDGYYAVLVREGTTLADVAPSIAALLVFSAVFCGIGLALFRFEK